MSSTMNWNEGYVSEIDYIHGYYREQAPGFLALAALASAVDTALGVHANSEKRPLRYLELGFGLGLTTNIHAAATDAEYWGTDFNPGHVAEARAIAQAAGSGARLFEDSFAEFAARTDLPEFDVIALHGVWTWVSDENRRSIIDLVRRRLAVSGVVYLSYNSMPGWAPLLPLQHLLSLHERIAGAPADGLLKRLDAALGFAQQVCDTGALYFQNNPTLPEQLRQFAAMNRRYLSHEFFNRHFQPMPFSQVAEALGEAKLDFVGTANLLFGLDAVSLTPEARTLLDGITHPILRESVRDYFTNGQFRRDLFAKGGRRLGPTEQEERFEALRVALVTHPDGIPRTIKIPIGEAELKADTYGPMIEVLSEGGYAPRTLASLRADERTRAIPLHEMVQAVVVLTSLGHLHPVQPPDVIARCAPRCRAINRHLLRRARKDGDTIALASPVIGAGVHAPRIHQLFLLAIEDGERSQAAWVERAVAELNAGGTQLYKEGQPIDSEADARALLSEEAAKFEVQRLPLLRALGVTDGNDAGA